MSVANKEDKVFTYFTDLRKKIKKNDPKDIIEILSYNIARNGTGIMTGAGFSKAVSEDGKAKNWLELFSELIQKLNNLNPNQFDENYLADKLQNAETLPKIGSDICEMIAETEEISISDAEKKVKKMVSALVNWVPNEKEIEKYQGIFKDLSVNWCVTMNYDDVLEAILGESGFTINPLQPIVAPMGKIPVYHIHGSKHDPKHLILTYEDYVRLFQPGNYREAKLSTLLAERSTIIMGYSVSDINIAASMAHKEIFFKGNKLATHEIIINLEYDAQHNDEKFEAVKDKSGILYNIKVNDISKFLKCLGLQVIECKKMMNKARKLEENFVDKCEAVTDAIDQLFQTNDKRYKNVTNFLEYGNFSSKMLDSDQKKFLNVFCDDPSSEIAYVSQVFNELNGIQTSDKFNRFFKYLIHYEKGKTHAYDNFLEYNKLLNFLLDTLENTSYSLLSPSNMNLITKTLNYTFSKSGIHEKGKAEEAEETWIKRGKEFHTKNSEIWDEIYIQAQLSGKDGSIIQHFGLIEL